MLCQREYGKQQEMQLDYQAFASSLLFFGSSCPIDDPTGCAEKKKQVNGNHLDMWIAKHSMKIQVGSSLLDLCAKSLFETAMSCAYMMPCFVF